MLHVESLMRILHNEDQNNAYFAAILTYRYEAAGSHIVPVTYAHATYAQVKALVDQSDRCEYAFRYDCRGSIMTNYAWWVGNDGKP